MSELKWHFYFNKIFVLESLHADERHTGRELNEDSLHYAMMAVNSKTEETGVRLSTEYCAIRNKEQFIEIIEKILSETQNNGVGPVIHFEIHGSKKGLQISDGSQFVSEITWHELSALLLPINIASKFNLFITFAVCYGGYFIQSLKPMQPPAFWGFVGAIQIVKQTIIAEGFSEFYINLFNGKNTNDALKKLNIIAAPSNVQFALVNAFKVFLYFFRKAYTKDQIGQVVERLLSIQPIQVIAALARQVGSHNIRRHIRDNVYTPELKNRYLQKSLARTFLWDDIPENRTRFAITYEELMQIKEDFHYFW